MQTLTNAVKRIKTFIASPTAQPDEALVAAAAAFADTWTRTSARLHRIIQLGETGHVWEAVQLADAYPPVLETGPLLLFNGCGQWFLEAANNNLAVPEASLTEQMYQRVNLLYPQAERLAPILYQYHRLILSRAPTWRRIRMLRSMLKAAPDQSQWEAELLRLEEHRQDELRSALDRAVAENDVAALLYIHDALHRKTWTRPVDPALLRRVENIRAGVAKRLTAARYGEVAAKIEEAYEARSVDRIELWLAQWQGLAQFLGAPPPEMSLRVEAALAWAVPRIIENATYRHGIPKGGTGGTVNSAAGADRRSPEDYG